MTIGQQQNSMTIGQQYRVNKLKICEALTIFAVQLQSQLCFWHEEYYLNSMTIDSVHPAAILE